MNSPTDAAKMTRSTSESVTLSRLPSIVDRSGVKGSTVVERP